MTRNWLAAGVLTIALVIVGCTPGGAPGGDTSDNGFTVGSPQVRLASALVPFDACDDLMDYTIEHALELVGPWGLGGGGRFLAGMEGVAVDEEMAEDAAAAPDAASREAPQEGVDFSGTNVQEAGIDEPDFVKTDGRTVFLIRGDRLHTIDVSGAEPRELGSIRLDGQWGHQLLLDGDRLLVLAGAEGSVTPMASPDVFPMWSGVTQLTLLDVADPAAPRELEQLQMDGWLLSARLTDGIARVVVRAEPSGLPFVGPEGGGLRAEREATERNREVVRNSTPDNWIPFTVHTDERGRESEGRLIDCDRMNRPPEFSGLGTVAVVTIDPSEGLQRTDTTGVLAGGDTVYASADRLYVATNRWMDWEALRAEERDRAAESYSTEIHAFDTTDSGSTRYVASGQVRGHLLSQWSFSEHDGYLRVATTEGTPWFFPVEADQALSESFVTVLAEEDGELAQVGQVGGLGLDERIFAVRFIGDTGYVVTFREVDPLYVVDLRDPTDPVVRGELKILGYSAYLHPIGDDLLLGIGQDATEEGRIQGTQVSVFDVSDPTEPTRLHQLTLSDAHSEAEWDHKAFLHWPPTGLSVLPFETWRWIEDEDREEHGSGALGFVADREGIHEVGRVSHVEQVVPDGPEDPRYWDVAWRGRISRAIVVRDQVLTVSDLGIAIADLDTFAAAGWLPLGR